MIRLLASLALVCSLSAAGAGHSIHVQPAVWIYTAADQDALRNAFLDLVEAHYAGRTDGVIDFRLGQDSATCAFRLRRYKDGFYSETIKMEWRKAGMHKGQKIVIEASRPRPGFDDRLKDVEAAILAGMKEKFGSALVRETPAASAD